MPLQFTHCLLCLLLHPVLHLLNGWPAWRCEAGLIRAIPALPTLNFSRPGDVNFGIILSLHRYKVGTLCSDILRELGALQRLEAMVFAVEEINNRSDILPNITLGFTILDDCGNEMTALARAMHFIQHVDANLTSLSSTQSLVPVRAVAVVGTERSPNTLQIADMLSLFEVPVLSYASSSAALDDKQKYPYFSRTVPSDDMQARAIMDILLLYEWSYVSVVYSAGAYGTTFFRAIQNHMDHHGYCTAVTFKIMDSHDDKEYNDVLEELLTKPQARVVILITTNAQALGIFKAVARRGMAGTFTWVGGDDTLQDFRGLEAVVEGMLEVTFQARPVDRFERHFRNMTLGSGQRNPWFQEFAQSIFNCSLRGHDPQSPPSRPSCDVDMEIARWAGYKEEGSASQAMNAIYTLAHALDALLRNCSLNDVMSCLHNQPSKLLHSLREVNFEGENGDMISMDKKGNGNLNYIVRCHFRQGGTLAQRIVGTWSTSTSNMTFFNKSAVVFSADFLSKGDPQYPLSRNAAGDVFPVSVCKASCPPGQQAVVTLPSCCFYCEACRENERVIRSGRLAKCQVCPTAGNFTWPDSKTRTQCLPVPITYLDHTQLQGILVITLDFLLFVFAVLIFYFYVKNHTKRLIKASSRELSILMLTGQMLTCVLVLLYVLPPSTATCILAESAFNLSFTMTYSPLLVKTNRIYRLFQASKRVVSRPPFVTMQAQLVIACLLIAVQLLLVSVCVSVTPPVPMTIMPNLNEIYVMRECRGSVVCFLAAITYNLVLMALCAFYAIKTRSLPANFNDTKFITFTIYTTLLMWLSFFPTYFTSERYSAKAMCLAVAMLCNVALQQIFCFLPKLYALYFLLERDMHLREDQSPTPAKVLGEPQSVTDDHSRWLHSQLSSQGVSDDHTHPPTSSPPGEASVDPVHLPPPHSPPSSTQDSDDHIHPPPSSPPGEVSVDLVHPPPPHSPPSSIATSPARHPPPPSPTSPEDSDVDGDLITTASPAATTSGVSDDYYSADHSTTSWWTMLFNN